MKSVFFLLMAFLLFQPALGLEIVDIYSNPRSCDVTAEGTGKGDLLRVDLFTFGKVLQSRTLALNHPGTGVLRWDATYDH